jgi:hypothetical protein
MPKPPAADVMPRFGDLNGSGYYSLPLKPPFAITNLSCRLFPLRANLDTLQGFCNNYVNIVPQEIAYFRACSPYLFLMMLDYGSLALEATNLGWFSQHEIMFCVPVEWYKRVNGRLEFQDWAMLTPFIFVDDDLSLNMGRTVAGWPKTLARMTPTLSAWMQNPNAPVNEATASAMVFPELYSGKKEEQRVFLEIERDAPISNLKLPYDARNAMAPWTIASNMADSMSRLGRDAMTAMNGMGFLPQHEGSTRENYERMMRNAARSINPLRPNMTSNILNLKQFRASENPDRYCYQALTIGAMKFTTFNGMGLLGEQNVMGGDISGGYTIKLHEWPSIPITRLLGLDVLKRWQGNGAHVAEIKPVMPYWYDSNMIYDTGYNVAWRSRKDFTWHDREGKRYAPARDRGVVVPRDVLYNTTLGTAAKPVAGPFRFAGTTIRVLPLLAWRETLQKFLDEYLNAPLTPTGERFEVWAPEEEEHAHVYMTATSFGAVTSATNNIGDWADAGLSFFIPVRRYKKGTAGPVGVGLVPAFTYVDNVTAALARSEVLGIPTVAATFIEAESSWMAEDGPSPTARQTLLRVDAEVLPVIGEGEKTQKRTIVEIVGGPAVDASGMGWRNSDVRFSGILREELRRKKKTAAQRPDEMKRGRALALELLANRSPIALYTMKQFRDNADPDNACYQSIVRAHNKFVEVLDMREIEQPLVVRIHDYPTQQLVNTLGLIGKAITGDGLGISYGLKPIRPFWMRVTMIECLGEPMLFRASTEAWTDSSKEFGSYFDSEKNVGVGIGMDRIQNEGDPRRMVKTAEDWFAFRRDESVEGNLTVEQAREVAEHIDPQMIIDSLLSREWGNWYEDARWRDGRRDVVARFQQTLSGAPAEDMGHWEQAFFKNALQELGKRPGEQAVNLDPMVAQLKQFSAQQTIMDGAWAIMVDVALDKLYPDQRAAERAAIEKAAPVLEKLSPQESLAKLVGALEAFLRSIKAICFLPVIGEPSSPDVADSSAMRDLDTRLLKHVTEVIDPIAVRYHVGVDSKPGPRPSVDYTGAMAEIWQAHDVFREAVVLARARCVQQREALFNRLSKAYQKPDYCVPRDSCGDDADRLFPLAESWDKEWYAGPDVNDEPVRPPGFVQSPTRRNAREMMFTDPEV